MKLKITPKVSFVIILFLFVIFIFFLPYYPKKIRYLFFILFCIWIFILFRFQDKIYFFIPWIFITLGNHPGGRFLEVGIYFIFVVGIFNLIQNIHNIFFFKELIKIYLLIWIPLLTNILLFLDWEHYYINFYHILSSTELEPFYPVKQLITTFIFSIVILSILSKKEYYKSFKMGFLISFLFLVLLGFLEYLFVDIQNILDIFQIWVSGYTDRDAPNHFNRFGFNKSIKSLFWNRSWFAMYIITSLPFIVHFFIRKLKNKIYIIITYLLLLLHLFLIGSRGALLSFFISFLLIYTIYKFFKSNKIIVTTLYLFISISYFLFIIFPLSNSDLIRREHLLSGIEAFKLSIISGWGFDSYGWVNEMYLRGKGLASYFHSTHNDYLNFLVGNGIILFIYYLWIHIKLLNKNNHFLYNVSILSLLIYKNIQEWTYIPVVFFLFLFLIFYHLRKELKIQSNYYYLIGILLIIGSILRPLEYPEGYGVFRNPLDGSVEILAGRYKLYGDSVLKVCEEVESKEILPIKEVFISDFIENPESRKFCKK